LTLNIDTDICNPINKGEKEGKDKWEGGKELKLRKGEEFSIPTFHTVAPPMTSVTDRQTDRQNTLLGR